MGYPKSMESIYEQIEGHPTPRVLISHKYTPHTPKVHMNKLDLGAAYDVPAFTNTTAMTERFKWISEAKDLEATAMQIAKREVNAMRKVRRLGSDLTQLIHSVDSIEELRAIITPKEGDSLSAYQNRIKSHVP